MTSAAAAGFVPHDRAAGGPVAGMDLFKKKTKIKCSFTFTLQAGNYIVATKARART